MSRAEVGGIRCALPPYANWRPPPRDCFASLAMTARGLSLRGAERRRNLDRASLRLPSRRVRANSVAALLATGTGTSDTLRVHLAGRSHADLAPADRESLGGDASACVAADRGDESGRGARPDGGDIPEPQGRVSAGRPRRGAHDPRPRRADPRTALLAQRPRKCRWADPGDRLLSW